MDAPARYPTRDARLSLLRAAAFAIATVGVGAGGHAVLTGAAPPLGLVALLLVSTMLLALCTARVRPHAGLAAIGVLAGQGIVHVALGLAEASSSASAGGGGAAGHVSHHAHMHAGHAAASPAASMMAMIAVHVVAAAIGIVLFLAVERVVWRAAVQVSNVAIATVRRLLARAGTDAPAVPQPVGAPAAARRSHDLCSRRYASWSAGAGARRGPPAMRLRTST